MHADELVAEVEPLTFRQRCRRLVELRELARTRPAEFAGLLRELGERGHYERSLALSIAVAAGQAVRDDVSRDHLRRAIRDRDADLAARAISAAARLGLEAAEFQRLLDDAPAAVRAATYKAIRTWRRTDAAESLIDRVTARWGEAEGASLLPVCGEQVAAERLDRLAHAVRNWKSFASAHPDLMLDHAERELAGLPDGQLRDWWWRHAPGVAAAVPQAPARVIGLLERYWRSGPLPQALSTRLNVLLDAEPARTLALLLAPEHRSELVSHASPLWRRSVRDRLVRPADSSADADLVAVARAVRENTGLLARLLKSTAPSRRDRILTGAMEGVDLTGWEPDDALLEVLPAARRTREAERMLRLRRVAETPARYWAATALLPYEQAEPVLRAVMRRTDATDRATGYRLLIACAGRSRDPRVLTELLESLARLRNEQDPVRLAAIGALAAIPPGMIEPVHVPAFAQMVDDALAARDCSHQTRYGLVRLATRVFEQGAIRDDRDLIVFAVETFARLTGHMGSVYLGRLDRVLRKGQEHDLVAKLADQLDAEAARDEHRLAFTLAQALGRRAHGVPVLQDALEKALDARSDGDIKQAIAYWLAPPGDRAERVAVVVAKDPSTVRLDPVLRVIARERTDLLHLVLAQGTPAGRFRRADVAYVPIAPAEWTRRWTGRQCSAYLALLHRLAGAGRTPDHQRAGAVRSIGEVPGVSATELRRYLESGNASLRRAALTAAPHIAAPQDVLPDLLALASSDDAHVATYAATRAARFTPPSTLADALAPVITEGKITARKEALRLLIAHRVPHAAERLAAVWDDPSQHHDVKAAIVSTARGLLGEPVALRVLTEAAAGPAGLARQVLGVAPLELEPRWRSAYAELVLRVARSADAETRNEALRQVPGWVPWAPDGTTLLAAQAGDLTTTASWRPALTALIACVATGTGTADLRSLAAGLAAAPVLAEAQSDRDRPAVQRLEALTESVRAAACRDGNGGDEMGHMMRAVEQLSAELPEPLAAVLVAATLRWDHPQAALAIDRLAGSAIGAVLAIDRVARALADSACGCDDPDHAPCLGRRQGRYEPDLVLPHARRLGGRVDLTAGLMACALARHHGPRAGWSPPWRDLLRQLRRHPHPEVAYAATQVRTAAE